MKGLGQDMPYFWLLKTRGMEGIFGCNGLLLGLQQVNLDEFTVGNRFEDRSLTPITSESKPGRFMM